jgi:hypothetical protein
VLGLPPVGAHYKITLNFTFNLLRHTIDIIPEDLFPIPDGLFLAGGTFDQKMPVFSYYVLPLKGFKYWMEEMSSFTRIMPIRTF